MNLRYEAKPLSEMMQAVEADFDFKRLLPWLWPAVLGVFLICNTSYLVYEQLYFYQNSGYTFYEGLSLSLLCEVALLLLSILSVSARERSTRMLLKCLLFGSFILLALILAEGVKVRSAAASQKGELVELLKDDVARVKQKETNLLTTLAELDAMRFKSKEAQLKKELESLRKTLSQKQEQLSQLLASPVHTSAAWLLQLLRFFALMWNVVLGRVLGRKLSSLVS